MLANTHLSGVVLGRLPMGRMLIIGVLICSIQAVAGSASATEDAAQETSSEALEDTVAAGEEVYRQRCALCHQANGRGLPGVFPPLVEGAQFDAAPSITRPLEERGFYKNGKIMLGPIDTNIQIVMNGIPGTRMFGFGQELSNEEIAAVVTYMRNAWGNDTGDLVAPEQVEPLRK